LQETWAVAKTKENAIVVEKPQLGKKPADVEKAANLQNLAARYYSQGLHWANHRCAS
jgi:hypothetical protein